MPGTPPPKSFIWKTAESPESFGDNPDANELVIETDFAVPLIDVIMRLRDPANVDEFLKSDGKCAIIRPAIVDETTGIPRRDESPLETGILLCELKNVFVSDGPEFEGRAQRLICGNTIFFERLKKSIGKRPEIRKMLGSAILSVATLARFFEPEVRDTFLSGILDKAIARQKAVDASWENHLASFPPPEPGPDPKVLQAIVAGLLSKTGKGRKTVTATAP